MDNVKFIYRIIFAIIGITILAIGVSFMRYAVLGVDPITCLNIGIAQQIGISFGTWQLIMCFILLVGVFIFDRSKIGFGTVYIMVAAGYTSDLFLWLITQIPFLEIFSLEIRIAAFSIGLVFYYFGAAVYIETNMGLSPYDAVGIIIAEKIKRQNWFKWIRIGTDALCVIGGIITKSNVGIGTLVSVLLGGPLIALFRKLLIKIEIK
ncbi:MAG: hypothetical protein FWF55_09635 [Treponema sp.]|nr:hypothetical protein [Treponema sp.]